MYKTTAGKLTRKKIPQATLTPKEVRRIRKLYQNKEFFQHELASMFGVSQAHIFRIVRNRAWTHLRVV